MKSRTCPTCGASDVRAIVFNDPIGTSDWRSGDVAVVRYVCLGCGYIEAYVADIAADRARLAASDHLRKLPRPPA